MDRYRWLELDFRNCVALHREEDVVAMVAALRPLGLALAVGPWTFDGTPTPASNVAQRLAEGHVGWNQIWRQAKARPRDPLKHTDTWASGLLRLDQPHTYATLSVTRRGWDIWDILIGVTAGGRRPGGGAL